MTIQLPPRQISEYLHRKTFTRQDLQRVQKQVQQRLSRHFHQPGAISQLLYLALVLITLLVMLPSGSRSQAVSAYSAVNVYGQGGSYATAGTGCSASLFSLSNAMPGGLAVDQMGGLYVADTSNNRVLYFPPNTTTATKVWGQVDFTHCSANQGGSASATTLSGPEGLALDGNGNLFVADTNNNRVLMYPNGTTTASRVYGQGSSFTTTTSNNGGLGASSLKGPTSVAIDSSNNVYVVDNGNNRALYYTATTMPISAADEWGQANFTTGSANRGGSTGQGTLNNPTGIAVSGTTNVYIADCSNNRVLLFTSKSTTGPNAARVYGQGTNNNYTGNSSGVSTTAMSCPQEVSVDANGNLYVLDTWNNRMLYFKGGVTTVTALRQYGQTSFTNGSANQGGTEGQTTLNDPTAAALDTNGNLFIADNKNERILQFQLGLTISTQPASSTATSGTFTVGVTAQDVGSGLTFSDYGANATVALDALTGSAGATLNGTLTKAFSSGIASFTGLSVNVVGSGYKVIAASTGYISAETNSFSITACASGCSYMANNVAGENGYYTTSGGVMTFSSTFNPGPFGVAMDSAGDAYISDPTDNRVLFFPAGSIVPTVAYGQPNLSTSAAGTSATGLKTPHGVFVDSNNNLYIADNGNNRVLYYPNRGAGNPAQTTATRVFGQAGMFNTGTVNLGGISADSLKTPDFVITDSSGNVYISDTGNNRILYYPSGQTTATRVYGQGGSFTTNTANNGGRTANSLSQPEGIRLDKNNNLYTADYANNRILEYPSGNTTAVTVWGQSGNFTTNASGTSSTTFNGPWDVTLDSSVNMYVSDYTNSRVVYFPVSGALPQQTATVVYGQPNLTSGSCSSGSGTVMCNPEGVALDSSGNIYISDQGNFRVLYFASGSTTPSRAYGQDNNYTTSGAGGTQWNYGLISEGSYNPGVVADSSGNLYVTDLWDNRVLYFPKGSTIATRVYGDGSGCTSTGLSTPNGIALDSSGGLYVTDAGNNRVVHFPSGSTTADRVYGQGSSGTNFTSCAANSPSESATSLNTPYGVGVDNYGNVYIADYNNSRVLFYSGTSVTATQVYGEASFTSSPGGCSAILMNGPDTVAFDGNNNLYVADHPDNRVLMFPAAGSGGNNPAQTTATKAWGQADAMTSCGWSTGATGLNAPHDLAFDAQGNLYISDSSNNRILFYPAGLGNNPPSETATRVYGQPAGNFSSNTANVNGENAGTLNGPFGITVDNQGDMFVLDVNNNRILQYQLGLAVTTQPPATVNAQNAFSFNVTAEDVGSGLTFTDFGGMLTASIKPGTGAANAILAAWDVTAQASSGVTPFSNLTIDRNGTYTLQATSPGFYSVYTNSFSVITCNASCAYVATNVYAQNSYSLGSPNGSSIDATDLAYPHAVSVDSSGNVYIADSFNNRVLKYNGVSTTAGTAYGQTSLTTNLSYTDAYGVVNTFSTSRPEGVVADKYGDVYVADQYGSRVLFFPYWSTTATEVYGEGSSGNAFNNDSPGTTATYIRSPIGLALDSSGDLFVVDQNNNRVLMYPSSGSGIAASPTATRVYGQAGSFTTGTANNGGISANSLNAPSGVAVDSSGNVYIADTGNNRVLFYSGSSTTATRVYGQVGSFTTNTNNNGGLSATSLSGPTGVAVDSSGNVYIVDQNNYRVLYYSGTSTTASTVYGEPNMTSSGGGTSSTLLAYPYGLALDSSNDLFVADENNNRVVMFPTGGAGNPALTTATRVYGQSSMSGYGTNANSISNHSLNGLENITVDSSGNLYATDLNNNRVLFFPAGSTTATRVYGQSSMSGYQYNQGTTPGATTLNQPGGVAVDSNGNVYIADTYNNRVLEYSGTSTTATTVYGQGASGTDFVDTGANTGATGMSGPMGLAVDSSNNLYVAEQWNNRVLFFPHGTGTNPAQTTATKVYGQGSSGTSFGTYSSGTSSTAMNSPQAVALDSNGNMYVADTVNNRVLEFPSGGAGNPPGTTAATVYGQGSAGTSFGTSSSGTSATAMHSPDALAVDSMNNLYVGEYDNIRAIYFPHGTGTNPVLTTATRVYGQSSFTSSGSGTAATYFGAITGVAVDNKGELFLADQWRNRVLQFQLGLSTSTQPPASVNAGVGFSVGFTVQDVGSGVTFTDYSGNASVAITTNPGSGTLSGTITVAASSGVASFSGLSINNGGTGYVLTGSSTGYISSATNSFNVVGGTGALNSPPMWSNQYRRPITIINNSSTTALPLGYTITDDVTGLDISPGSDLHVVYWNGSTNTELDRDIETDANTGNIYARFELQASIPASNSDTTHYWLYYGPAGNPGTPMSTLSNVYQHYTDFTTGSWNDAAFWGSQPGCSTLQTGANGGIALVSTGSGCALIAAKNSATGYAAEFTTEELNTTGYGEMEFYNNTGPEYVRIQYSCSGQVWKLDAQTSNSNATTTCPNPSVSIPTGTFNVYTISRPVNTAAYYSFDFGNQYSITTNLPTNNMYPAAEATNNTETVSQFRLRLAIDSEPAVSNGALQPPTWAVDTTQISAGARYEFNFTTVTSGSISSITMTVPSGTTGSPATQENWGISSGTAALAGNTITYTVTSPKTIPANTPIRLVITGLTNTGSAGTSYSTITTYNGGSAIDQGTTNSITFGAGNTSSGLQADAESSTVSSVLTSANLVLDPLTNNTATYTYNVTMTTDACTSWSMAFKDGGLKTGGYTINPVSSNGVANAVTWPTGSDKNVVGYQISGVTPTNGSAAYQGTLSSSNYAGFKTSNDTILSGTPNSGATETITFTVTVKVQVGFATKAGLYSDTPQLTFTPSYC